MALQPETCKIVSCRLIFNLIVSLQSIEFVRCDAYNNSHKVKHNYVDTGIALLYNVVTKRNRRQINEFIEFFH